MSLLNDEPSDPRPEPPKRVSSVASAPPPSHTPPPQHPLQANRFAAHSSQPTSQPPQAIPAQLQQQIPPSQQAAQQHAPQPQHPYAQASPHPMHQHSSSVGHARSYTPTSFEGRGYGAPPSIQQQQAMYSQPPPRQSLPPQPTRREPSLGEVHGLTGGYSRAGPSQSSMRLKESPYSSTPPPASTQSVRQQVASPHDLAPPSDRDFYARAPQQQYLMQQQSATASPQLGPSYHSQAQQQQQSQAPGHRQLAFGQSPSHIASPPSHFASQHQLHRSRHNSFDGRYPNPSSAGSTPSHQGYAQPPHQPAHPSMQYQQPHPSQERFESSYDRDLRERRMQEEAAYHQRRLDESSRR
ncbi:hypothetical protein G7Y89_g14135 [Cudoniella acicularis]|uniref:Uncharacterized protein n=1 Tax=Cudoniella acicularis TaxID=354080 RepID=A0A8H4R8D1_9HELO|nr:hypothetical protein G7Y89_g14135 [Cudoniella acicularis]